MRSGTRTPVGVVTKLVHMHTTFRVGIVPRNVPGDGGGRGFRGLLKGDLAGDLGITTDDGDCSRHESALP